MGSFTLADQRNYIRKLANKIKTPVLVDKVMASPPIVTLTTVPIITSPLSWPSVYGNIASSAFTFLRAGAQIINGGSFPDYNFIKFQHITSASGVKDPTSYCVSIIHHGSELEFSGKGSGGTMRVKVDGEYISLTPITFTNNGSQYRYYIPFGSVAKRRVDFECYNVPFGGFYTAQTDTIIPAPIDSPRVIIMGDSFLGAAGYRDSFSNYLGWPDVWASGVGSTGILATNNGTKYKYRERILTDVVPFNPDIVIFPGSINDNIYTGAQIADELKYLINLVRSYIPNCLICATSPLSNGGVAKTTINMWDQHEQIKTVIESNGGLFLSMLELPLPINYTLGQITLSANASAGASTITAALSGTDNKITGTYKFPDKSRFRVKSYTGTGPYTMTLDSPLLTAQSSGVVATQVGDSMWTGIGKVGATTGYGNSDILVQNDGTHPSDPSGYTMIGTTMAMLLLNQISRFLI